MTRSPNPVHAAVAASLEQAIGRPLAARADFINACVPPSTARRCNRPFFGGTRILLVGSFAGG